MDQIQIKKTSAETVNNSEEKFKCQGTLKILHKELSSLCAKWKK